MRYFPGIEEETTTTGTGTVTLTGVTGRGRFSDVFSDGELCAYTIVDGNNLEFGLGEYTASNQLARTKVIATLVSGTYDTSSPTAITLAAGTKAVYHSTSNMLQAGTPAPSSVSKRYHFDKRTVSNVTRTASATRVYYRKHTVDTAAEFTGIACEVTTAQAGANLRMGVYTEGADGEPDVKLAETAIGSAATAADVEAAFSTPLYLSPGEYWLAWITDTANVAVRIGHYNDDYQFGVGANAISAPYGALYESGSGTTLPAEASASLTGEALVNVLMALYL